MIGADEIIFSGAYKDFKFGVHFNLDGKQEKEVAQVLGYISSAVEPHAFRFSGINTKMIDDFAKPAGKGISAVCSFLENTPQAKIKDSLGKALSNPKLLPAAESCFFNSMLTKAGVGFRISATDPPFKPSEEKLEGQIAFIGKYKSWIAIKKLGLEDAEEYEVSGILSGIDYTIVNKAFDFAGVKKDDATVNAVTKGKRKSYGNLLLCLRELESKLTGSIDDAYLVCKVMETLGYRPYASPEMLSNAHPDIKPPKVRGRKPKG
jgi:hypothetical protein